LIKNGKNKTNNKTFFGEESFTFEHVDVLLVYPNNYSVGLSNLGQEIIYTTLRASGLKVGRVFYDGRLQNEHGQYIAALSKGISLIAFSISFEMDFFNIPKILKALNVSLHYKDRTKFDPLVIAGGSAVTVHHKVVEDFFDLIFLGEGEESLPEFIDYLRNQSIHNREDFIKGATSLEGISSALTQNKTSRRIAADKYLGFVLKRPPLFNDMNVMELTRGCKRNCYFCVAKQIYETSRYPSLERTLEIINSLEERRLGLIGPNVTDCHYLPELLKLDKQFMFSSLAINSRFIDDILVNIAPHQKQVTFAIETNHERLQKIINKPITTERIKKVITKAFEVGIFRIKLYYMLGIPTETEDEIRYNCDKIKEIYTMMAEQNSKFSLKISLSPFIPKPHTLMYPASFEDPKSLRKKYRLITHELDSYENLKIDFTSIKESYLQATLCKSEESLFAFICRTSGVSYHTKYDDTARVFEKNLVYQDLSLPNNAFGSFSFM